MSKDLGKSTSYAYYVAEGGTKTPQEYGEMLVNIDTVATRAEDAADSAAESATGALNSKNAAQTAATTATNKASEATTAATTATNKAAEAQADADAAALDASQAMSAASTATTKATEAATAAATATSAKTDAVAANTAAQSAKTAAQTAQAGAETAAASVQSSAAQIATNTSDITELKEDLTATNAEVTDIRVGAYGKTYNSAGAAVRGQISDLTTKTRNLFASQWESGGLIIDDESKYGEESNSGQYANWFRTGFIPVDGLSDYYTVSASPDGTSASGNIRLFYYDANKEYITRSASIASVLPQTIDLSAYSAATKNNTRYIRLVTESRMYQTDYQMEIGRVATPYIPHYVVNTEYADFAMKHPSKNINGGWEVGGIEYSTGADSSSAGVRTGYIPVEANKTYAFSIAEFKSAPNVYAFFYDSGKKFISRITTTYGYFPKVITIPDNANIAFVRLNAQTVDIDISNGQAEESIMSTTYRSPSEPVVDMALMPNSVKGYRGKRIVVFGDSITAIGDVESTANSGWTSYFKASVKPSDWHNYAVGGSTWCDYPNGDSISDQIDAFVADDVSDVDCFIISSGTNDINTHNPTDEEIEAQFFDSSMNVISLANVDKTTWAGAMRYAIGTLAARYPKAKIFICTPIHRRYTSAEPVRSAYSSIKAKNEIIKKLCARCGVECIDALECGISPSTTSEDLSLWLSDGLHTKPIGAWTLARYITARFMRCFNIE